jgi:hypothetical protein
MGTELMTTRVESILDYRPPQQPPPRKLTLEETDSCVRVIFGVAPAWVPIISIVTQLTIGVASLAALVAICVAVFNLFHSFGKPTPELLNMEHQFFWQTLPTWGTSALLWLSFAAHEWWMYRRWGRVPRVLTANADGITYSRLRWWRIRERRLPSSEISSIELKVLKWNLNRKRTVADLYIRRLHFRLSSSDPRLPKLIAQRLAAALGRPLT